MEKAIINAAKVQVGNLDPNNYKTWRYKIQIVLKAMPGCFDILNGKKTKPTMASTATVEERAKFEEDLQIYESLNSAILILFTTNMSDDILKKILRFDSAKDMWDELERIYGGTCVDKTYDVCLKFFSYKKDKDHDIITHLSVLKNIWSEMCTELQTEAKLPEILLICKILDTLPSDYLGFKSSWLLISEKERSVENLTNQLCAHERVLRQNGGTVKEDENIAEALYAKMNKTKKIFSKKVIFCNYCKEKGHRVRSCKKWILDGRPPKETNSVNMNLTVLTLHLAEGFSETKDTENWYVDNGATSHVTNRRDLFQSFTYFKSQHIVTGANGQCIDALGKGNILAESDVNGKLERILLKDVWYVPSISRNLFSVLASHDKSDKSVFESTALKCTFKIDGQIKVIGTREKFGGLFKLSLKCLKPIIQVNQLSTTSNLLQLYHERFGHQSKSHVRKLIEREFNIKTRETKELCEGCIFGKAHRLKFGTRMKATQPGELVYADVCGPFPYSISKLRYFVLFKDDYTSYRYVYFMREKAEVQSKLLLMLSEVKATGVVIKELLTDNGGEFHNDVVQAILEKEGIQQRFTMPYTPQQNPTERDNRTVVEMARSLMYAHARIPTALWAELVSTAVYILNRTGPTCLDGKSPYELWHHKKPRLSHLRIIGSYCYPHIPKERRKKLDKKAQKGILIGYDFDNGYRIWDSDSFKLIRSRDVIFDESPLLGHLKEIKEPDIPENNESSKSPDRQLFFGLPKYTSHHEDTAEQFSSQNEPDVEADEPKAVSTLEAEQFIDLPLNEKYENDNDEPNEVYDEAIEPDLAEGKITLRDRSNLKPPTRYKDFVCNVCFNVNPVYDVSLAEPKTFKEAMLSIDSEQWSEAMNNEINSLKENETWEMVNLPKGRKAIPCKWIYRIKTNPDGSIDKYKARLVVKGYSQKKGLDYSETFSPVVKISTIRAVISIAAEDNLSLSQFDVSTAFLYGSLKEEIYMKPPEGYSSNDGKVCKLKRSLYGLKQAPRCWNSTITEHILKLGFEQSKDDPCLFKRGEGKDKLIIALYVDDGLIASASSNATEKFYEEMRQRFKITTKCGSYFLGIEIERKADGTIKINQKGYTKRLLERFGMQDCKVAVTPIVKGNVLSSKDNNYETHDFPYRQAVGALSYLMVGTRPDIAFAVGVVSRKLDNPNAEDIAKVKRIFRYIKGTIDYGITYKSSTTHRGLKCFSDADHGGDDSTGRSTSGMICLYANGAITWQSKRQSTVAMSSTEAEVVAASEAAREILWLSRIIRFIHREGVTKIPDLFIDNESAIRLAHDPPHESHQRTKHIKLRHFFVRQCVLEKDLNIKKISTKEQVADFLTKPLFKPRLQELCNLLGLSG